MYSLPNTTPPPPHTTVRLRSIRLTLLVLAGSLLLAPVAQADICGFPTKEALDNKIANLLSEKLKTDKTYRDLREKSKKHLEGFNHEGKRLDREEEHCHGNRECLRDVGIKRSTLEHEMHNTFSPLEADMSIIRGKIAQLDSEMRELVTCRGTL